ncbi:STM4011 family radical SAM protein [Inediibacterium massiliense]|uniref:STM4011 family radical SAM protein n=1 Tax=Inediibacterium massiliense TaxID=1658111 RepID=UPI0006B593AD|nr:STM4011 family radical SAM protein [Inediibacterium massiliense]
MIENAKHLYYRGVLSSCNYTCYYCPFAKKKASSVEIERDQKALMRFCKTIENILFKERISIFFTPYGEAMTHPYYTKAMIQLAKLEKVRYISIQTNLSFDVNEFLDAIERSGVKKEKIKLWGSYHPTMVRAEEFAKKANQLSLQIDICVGMVALSKRAQEIRELKKYLSPDIYLWLNGQAKHKIHYSLEDLSEFKEIDPFFPFEMNTRTSFETCRSGSQSYFIEANGDILPCHMNKRPIGDFYSLEKNLKPFECHRKLCDCYLAYSNIKDIRMIRFFGNTLPVRIPQKRKYKAIFFDVDGTLTDSNGKISSSTEKVLKYLHGKVKLYFVTALPIEKVRKKCKSIWHLFQGGIFSNGTHVVDFQLEKDEFQMIPDKTLEKIPEKILKCNKLFFDRKPSGETLRVILPKKWATLWTEETKTYWVFDGIKAYRQSIDASKTKGVDMIRQWKLFKKEELLVVGNSHNDIPLFRDYPYSVAVLNASTSVRKEAYYQLNIDHLPYIISLEIVKGERT